MRTILIIDDDSYIRSMYRPVLEEYGYQVDEAKDGEEGLDKLQKSHYDLTFLDVMMPKMGGLDVLKKLKAENGKQGKIVVISNISDDNLAQEALSLDADGYEVTATITPERLISMVTRYLPAVTAKEKPKEGFLKKIKQLF